MIITIDGPAGTGKSSVSKEVAKRLNFIQLDTGALYRAIAYALQFFEIDESNEDSVSSFVKAYPVRVEGEGEATHYFIKDLDATPFLRTRKSTLISSKISTYKAVREILLPLQRALAENKNVVCEGRDMGSTVFPHAEVKVFLTAKNHIRAKRRYLELLEKGYGESSLETIQKELESRDTQDATRPISPLIQPQGAFVLDTSDLSLQEVVDQVITLIEPSKHPFFRHFETFHHQSDIGIRGYGHTLEEAFEEAALALSSVITELGAILPLKSFEASLSATSNEELFFLWINRLIYEMNVQKMLFSRYQVHIVEKEGVKTLTAKVFGEELRDEHEAAVEPKGATYHALFVHEEKKEGIPLFIAQCIVDV